MGKRTQLVNKSDLTDVTRMHGKIKGFGWYPVGISQFTKMNRTVVSNQKNWTLEKLVNHDILNVLLLCLQWPVNSPAIASMCSQAVAHNCQNACSWLRLLPALVARLDSYRAENKRDQWTGSCKLGHENTSKVVASRERTRAHSCESIWVWGGALT